MSADLLAQYEALEGEIIAAMRHDLGELEFNELALEIHAFQKRWNAPYAAWCAQRPTAIHWRDIPAVPQAMFKQYRLSCFPPDLATQTFRTSGTTGETRGEHHLRDTKLYDAAVLAGWSAVGTTVDHAIFLTPSPRDVPDSSLFHMFGTIATHAWKWEFGEGYFMCNADGSLNGDRLQAFLNLLRPAETVAVFGTALGFLNFFDWLGDRRVHLKAGSYALETGGFKGSGRDIPKEELYARFRDRLGLPAEQVWNEYGMCELASQFYTRGLGNAHRGGPWVRAEVISPETGEEVGVGKRGILRIIDLANAGSVLAIQTADVAVRTEDGFLLIGRDPAAVPRGCSRSADEAMRGAGVSISGTQTRPTAHQQAAKNPTTPPSLGTTRERAAVLAEAASAFRFLGDVTPEGLLELVRLELGHEEALDRFVPYGTGHTRTIPPSRILHILSGNTPAAALQTLIRGLLLGSWNRCKLPSAGLPEIGDFLRRLPDAWHEAVETSTELPDNWLHEADAVIVFGSDETIDSFRARIAANQIFVPHGHKLSFGIVFDDPTLESAPAAARDASVFDQQGCLSPTVYFVRESGELTVEGYAARLAQEMAAFANEEPPTALTLSEANAVQSLREELGFRAANGAPVKVFASAGTEWTVIADRTPGFPASPLNRVVFVKPLADDLSHVVAPLRPHLSTVGIWPSTVEHAQTVGGLGARRICAIGKMQLPAFTWHHDGQPVLAPLVTWIDWEHG